jgi:hypothetical protein
MVLRLVSLRTHPVGSLERARAFVPIRFHGGTKIASLIRIATAGLPILLQNTKTGRIPVTRVSGAITAMSIGFWHLKQIRLSRSTGIYRWLDQRLHIAPQQRWLRRHRH